ncbi:MAG: cytochrome c maturation protein CcmE [Gammaproteobacteria bacterium]|nr:cytochrome c maturation protein CcmE [Gammaproteobacteria bacterium]
MTPTRKRRLVMVTALVAGVGLATTLALRAFQENMLYFYSPTEFVELGVPAERTIRVGGLVADGSVRRAPGSMTIEFQVTDHAYTVPVSYTGVLPDLFREGQGVVARGRIGDNGVFVAENLMAKHDENYMPPEVAQALHAGKMRAIERAQQGFPAETESNNGAAVADESGHAGSSYSGGY